MDEFEVANTVLKHVATGIGTAGSLATASICALCSYCVYRYRRNRLRSRRGADAIETTPDQDARFKTLTQSECCSIKPMIEVNDLLTGDRY